MGSLYASMQAIKMQAQGTPGQTTTLAQDTNPIYSMVCDSSHVLYQESYSTQQIKNCKFTGLRLSLDLYQSFV